MVKWLEGYGGGILLCGSLDRVHMAAGDRVQSLVCLWFYFGYGSRG